MRSYGIRVAACICTAFAGYDDEYSYANGLVNIQHVGFVCSEMGRAKVVIRYSKIG